jgi:hypothetical protein
MCSSQQMLVQLAIILNKLEDALRLGLQPPEGGCRKLRSPARWSKTPWTRGIAPPEEFPPASCTPNPAPLPPHARGRSGTTRGSSASQPPVVFRPAYPPWVVEAGSGRVPGPKFAAGTAAGAAGGWRVSGPPGGPKIRWIVSVGWCPSKRVVVIHCARPYTAQKASGGPGTAALNY